MALTAVIALGWLLSHLFGRLGQPPVIGEVVAGIALGPSVLGRLSPETADFLLPSSAAPFLGVIAQIGIIIYMFLVGLELNLQAVRSQARSIVAIACTGIVIPFALGAALALQLPARLAGEVVLLSNFALFMGVALAMTAFPVLARILADGGMTKTPLGIMALACAALGDAIAWCLLAFVVGIAQAKVGGAVMIIVMTLAFVSFMFLVARPLAVRVLASQAPTRGVTALVFVSLLASALATELIGIHAIFGAFVLGAIIPHDSPIGREFPHKLEDLVTVLLLPAFFAFTGLRTQIGLVSTAEDWLICVGIIAVATVGKVGGTLLAARLIGQSWRDSAALGILMNTRGLMELIVLNIGLDLGVISPTLFAMMVLMALATTIATTPLLRLVGIQTMPQQRQTPPA